MPAASHPISKRFSTSSTTPVDQFTISVAANDPRHGTLILEWGSFLWTAPLELR
jgi:hypothetical protein